MRSREDRIDDNAINALSAILAGILIVSPLMLGFRSEATATSSAWIAGALVAIVSVGAVAKLHEWEEWVNLVLGLGIIVSPWVFGFSSVAPAMWTHGIVGVAVAGLSALEIWRLRDPPAAGGVIT